MSPPSSVVVFFAENQESRLLGGAVQADICLYIYIMYIYIYYVYIYYVYIYIYHIYIYHIYIYIRYIYIYSFIYLII